MENLDKQIMQAATGEKRYNPDEQRHYLGTFAERVVLAIALENIAKSEVTDHFDEVLSALEKNYSQLTIKIASKVPTSIQMFYLKSAAVHHIQATTIDESKAQSPFGLVIHTDHAVNLQEILFAKCYPQFFDCPTTAVKKSFWSKFFGK